MTLGQKLRKKLLKALGMEEAEGEALLAECQAEDIRALSVQPCCVGRSTQQSQQRLPVKLQGRPQRWRVQLQPCLG